MGIKRLRQNKRVFEQATKVAFAENLKLENLVYSYTTTY